MKRNQKKATTAINRILRENKKANRLMHSTAILDEDGRQCILGAYYVYRLTQPLPVEQREDSDSSTLNLLRQLSPCHVSITTPTIDELEQRIQLAKNNPDDTNRLLDETDLRLWNFGKGLPKVNVKYLRDMLTVLPGAALYASSEKPYTTPIYAISEYGEGWLCPVRTREKYEF